MAVKPQHLVTMFSIVLCAQKFRKGKRSVKCKMIFFDVFSLPKRCNCSWVWTWCRCTMAPAGRRSTARPMSTALRSRSDFLAPPPPSVCVFPGIIQPYVRLFRRRGIFQCFFSAYVHVHKYRYPEKFPLLCWFTFCDFCVLLLCHSLFQYPQIQVKASKYIKYFCAESDDLLHRWVTGIRLVKVFFQF